MAASLSTSNPPDVERHEDDDNMAASPSTSTPPDSERHENDGNMAAVDTVSPILSPTMPTPTTTDPAVALLAEIAASLKELRAHSDRFMKILDASEDWARQHEKRQGKMPERDIDSGSSYFTESQSYGNSFELSLFSGLL